MASRPPTQGIPPAQGIAVLGAGVAGMAIFVIPLVLGPVAMILGWLAIRKGEPRAQVGDRRGRGVHRARPAARQLPDKFVVT